MFEHNPLILIVSDRARFDVRKLTSNIEYYDGNVVDKDEIEFYKRQWHLASLKKDKRNMRVWQKRIEEYQNEYY